MQTWKKKLVVSQLALACTLAIASQANAATYDMFGYHDDVQTQYDWLNTTIDTDYLTYSGYVYNTTSDNSNYLDATFNNDTVNGVISTRYLNDDYTTDANTLNVTNSTIHGMITSAPVGTENFTFAGDNDADYIAHNWVDGDVFTLNVDRSIIDDDFEAFYFTDNYLDSDGITTNTDYDQLNTAGLGVAVTLGVESNINVTNNSHVAGIALVQTDGSYANDTYVNGDHQWDNNVNVENSTVTSGSLS